MALHKLGSCPSNIKLNVGGQCFIKDILLKEILQAHAAGIWLQYACEFNLC